MPSAFCYNGLGINSGVYNMTSYDKILGGLLAAALGDAMGSVTETRSREQIIEKFGGKVTELMKAPDDVFARDFPMGSVTDDFSLAYCTALEIINAGGNITDEVAKKALLRWSQTEYFKLAGPTTIGAVKRLKGEEVSGPYDFLSVDNSKGSNGSAMKISPVGLASHGNIKKAMRDAVTICKPTHYNSTSLAGACAVSAAVSEAMHDESTIESIIKAGLVGAKYGDEVGRRAGKELANPSVYKRIKLAVSIANNCRGDIDRTMEELIDIIGCGLSAAEAVPVAFGLLVACEGRTMDCITAAVNIGNDTDTIATILGAMVGTYNGVDDELLRYLDIIDSVNDFDLKMVAAELEMLGGSHE